MKSDALSTVAGLKGRIWPKRIKKLSSISGMPLFYLFYYFYPFEELNIFGELFIFRHPTKSRGMMKVDLIGAKGLLSTHFLNINIQESTEPRSHIKILERAQLRLA